MLDYGHNPAGVETVLGVCKKLEHRRLVGVVGVRATGRTGLYRRWGGCAPAPSTASL
jgi:cyanophycin synthetase